MPADVDDDTMKRRASYLVNWLDDPVDTRIPSDSFVLRVYQDDLEVFVGRILVDPVRVEDTEIGASTPDSLFRR